MPKGNSKSNYPIFLDVDILTSQMLFIFSLFVDNVEMINPWEFETSSPSDSKVFEIWKFDRNGCFGFWIFIFCNKYCSSHPFILKFGMGELFGVRNPKITLWRLKNKPVLRYVRFQVLGTCDQTDTEKYMRQDMSLKLNLSSFYIDINLSLSQKCLLVLF